jgi:acetyl/propionyl-CoA carboxylase alpha subunit
MRYHVEIDGRMRTVDVKRGRTGWDVRLDDGPEQAWSGRRLGAAEWHFAHGGAGATARVAIDGDRWVGQGSGAYAGGGIADPRVAVAAGGASAQGTVKAPMPGMVARVLVTVGQVVRAGDVLVVVEAMKMENEFKSRIAGVVRELHVSAGQAVAANAALVTVEPS